MLNMIRFLRSVEFAPSSAVASHVCIPLDYLELELAHGTPACSGDAGDYVERLTAHGHLI